MGRMAGAGDPDERVVVGIEGLGDQDLVPLVQHAGQDDLQRLAAAVGCQDLIAGDGVAQAGVIVPHRLQIDLHAGGGGISQNRLAEIPGRVEKGPGRLDVRLTDVQMVYPQALGPPPPPHRGRTSAWERGRTAGSYGRIS